ncbi:hypothetical protein [Enterobacter kobei]|uniref:hypothetical protein n=1 Tax=Enterobacter kobei TaxID=208224 RepID=UPI002A824966|nr:hypothetical protein [Enterobacter kobei]
MSVKRYEWVACDEHSCHCDVVESVEGDMVGYEDYAALKAKCAALAAENARLKESRKNLAEFIHEELDAGYPLNMSIETPATDAFLAEVRAQGVEMFADDLLCPDLDSAIREFAAQIRKGVQS